MEMFTIFCLLADLEQPKTKNPKISQRFKKYFRAKSCGGTLLRQALERPFYNQYTVHSGGFSKKIFAHFTFDNQYFKLRFKEFMIFIKCVFYGPTSGPFFSSYSASKL